MLNSLVEIRDGIFINPHDISALQAGQRNDAGPDDGAPITRVTMTNGAQYDSFIPIDALAKLLLDAVEQAANRWKLTG